MTAVIRCALGVITQRGANVIPPTLNELDREEHDYLARHVTFLRRQHTSDNTVFCVFAPGSPTRDRLQLALHGTLEEFVEVATEMVDGLAAAMRASPAAKDDCVVALVTSEPDADGVPTIATLLKLDANIEAAHLEKARRGRGVRLQVFQDLLPAPGDMQKGVSWPDPRDPDSELILHDTNRGDAALYFASAFSLRISSRSAETERALVHDLATQLGPTEAAKAVALVDAAGGRADSVVARVREDYPQFAPSSTQLTDQRLPGAIRPNHLGSQKLRFVADGIELRVPASKLNAVSATVEGDEYITTIRTSVPLIVLER